MAFPNVNPLIETFLEPTRIFLFGKRFPSLVYRAAPMSEGAGDAGDAALATVTAAVAAAGSATLPPAGELAGFSAPPDTKGARCRCRPGRSSGRCRAFGAEAGFARIYGFSFEGHYYKLPRPLLFLVRGDGHARAPEDPPAATGDDRQFNTRFTGIEGKDWQFGSDILVWAVDKHDIAVCLDLEIGRYEQVLLQWFIASEEEAANRSASASRSATSSRSAASFRSAALGPHQGR